MAILYWLSQSLWYAIYTLCSQKSLYIRLKGLFTLVLYTYLSGLIWFPDSRLWKVGTGAARDNSVECQLGARGTTKIKDSSTRSYLTWERMAWSHITGPGSITVATYLKMLSNQENKLYQLHRLGQGGRVCNPF